MTAIGRNSLHLRLVHHLLLAQLFPRLPSIILPPKLPIKPQHTFQQHLGTPHTILLARKLFGVMAQPTLTRHKDHAGRTPLGRVHRIMPGATDHAVFEQPHGLGHRATIFCRENRKRRLGNRLTTSFVKRLGGRVGVLLPGDRAGLAVAAHVLGDAIELAADALRELGKLVGRGRAHVEREPHPAGNGVDASRENVEDADGNEDVLLFASVAGVVDHGVGCHEGVGALSVWGCSCVSLCYDTSQSVSELVCSLSSSTRTNRSTYPCQQPRP